MKNVVILGVTGSIGKQSLSVIRQNKDLKILGASCRDSLDKLIPIIEEFKIPYVSVADEEIKEKLIEELKRRNIAIENIKIFIGEDGLVKLATLDEAQIILTSVVGLSGLVPTVEAIKLGKDIALANKETLVGAGEIVMNLARENDVNIYPVDSEHSAIFQCLQGKGENRIKKIILTASGGPYRGKDREYLKGVKLEETLKHPNWNMGRKVTVDSATLFNKGLEAIEARWLFDVEPSQIEVHVHKESIVHSAVTFMDNAVIAQLGVPDMKLPIQYALNYPKRMEALCDELDLFKAGTLSFEKPDKDTFRCLKYAFYAMEKGGFCPLIINTADEVAVKMYLDGEIEFLDIEAILKFALDKWEDTAMDYNIENILKLDLEIRNSLKNYILKINSQ